ncbi:lysozyme inhibitor LprI family protein [Pseudomonas sp. PDM20]|uniref:lysozyme inhibitor LprI family protein n=1 Tax=Pseudomonas sp. PDM20 TaxID=2769254 RepID=UPI00177B4F5F|nr:lysozyme inhibitor LprI family protein [Pseudomonas sp. PDM20]MBD9681500.1 DUF1311 domain-containing protein [Pseudomonas sp. PDM20]
MIGRRALLLLALPALALARDFPAEGEDCIAANSGADSVQCLTQLYYQSNLELHHLEERLVERSAQRLRDDQITRTHHEQAVSSLRDAARRYAKFSERQCDFAVGYAGAAASGAQQVFYSCLLRLNQQRRDYLLAALKS